MTELRRGAAFALVLVLVCGIFYAQATGAPGTAGDPVIRLSYLTGVFEPKMLSEANRITLETLSADQLLGMRLDELNIKLNQQTLTKALSPEVLNAVNVRLGQLLMAEKAGYSPAGINDGQMLVAPQGTLVTLVSGTAKLSAPGAVNLTTGAELGADSPVPVGHKLFFAGDSGGAIEFTANSTVMVDGSYSLKAAYTPQYEDLATALNTLGLLLGTGNGYELGREATRVEGLVLMIRMMGEESAALAFTGVNPMTDVPAWADRYVAYAYHMGWTLGVGGNRFAPYDKIDARQYMTMLLRAMEYDSGSFDWSLSLDVALQKGILLQSERDTLMLLCKRDHLVYMSYYALDGICLSGYTLQQKLLNKGVFTAEQLFFARSTVLRTRG